MPATSISEVIHALDDVIEWCKTHHNRGGYFAAMYRSVTLAVQKGIAENYFEDGPRMEALDVIFANLYLSAWNAAKNNQPCSKSWKAAFDACANNNLTVLQHLLLGMNTHINLDLANATAQAASGSNIFLLQTDFNKINNVIGSLTASMYATLCCLWPPLALILSAANHRHDAVVEFSISKARETSWANAVALSMCSSAATKENYLGLIDDGVLLIAKRIAAPGMAIRFMLKPVIRMEGKNVSENIDLLINGLQQQPILG